MAIEVAQAKLYPAPEARTGIARSIRIPIYKPLTRQEALARGVTHVYKRLRVWSKPTSPYSYEIAAKAP